MSMTPSTKKILAIAVVIVCVAAVCIYSVYGNQPEKKEDTDTWSIFIYMCGSSLETDDRAASYNLSELVSADYDEKINLIVETGGAKIWHNEDISNENIQRHILREDGLELLDTLPQANMGEEQTLTDFLDWGLKTYVADKYVLLMWDHGDGVINGMCWDEIFDDTLSLIEVSNSLTVTDASFDLVVCDTCLMDSIELSGILSDHADYFVASEETVPTNGMDYRSWYNGLADNTDMGAAELGKIVVDTYSESYRQYPVQYNYITMALIDLSAIETLSAEFDKLCNELLKSVSTDEGYVQYMRNIRDVQSYDDDKADTVDLWDYIKCNKNLLESTESFETAYKNAILHEYHGSANTKSHGLAVFYPIEDEHDLDVYVSLSVSDNYFDLLKYLFAE